MFKPHQRPFRYLRAVGVKGKAVLSGALTVLGFRTLIQAFGNGKKPERAKKVLRRSHLHALAHSLVHLIPMTVLVWITYLNYKGVYYGPGLSVFGRSDPLYFALYQVGAKTIELACVMSLCTILLHVLRHDLMHGGVVPLGLLTAPMWFVSPICLVSPEFLTAVQMNISRWWHFWRLVRHNRQQAKARLAALWRSSRMIVLLITLIATAALIGPAAAVLLIPRQQEFRAGGATYSLNATFEEMWPSNVSASDELEQCYGLNATVYPVCPSGGYASIRYQGGYNAIYNAGAWRPALSVESDIWDDSFLVRDPLGVVPAVLSVGATTSGWAPTYMSQPNLYTAIVQSILVRDWYSAVGAMFPILEHATLSNPLFNVKNFYFVDELHASGTSLHPITNVKCTPPQTLPSTAEEIGFPSIEFQPLSDGDKGWSKYNTTKPANIAKLSRNPTSHVRTQWVPLLVGDFGPVSTGLLLELPWTSTDTDGSRLVIACSVAAAWSRAPHARLTSSNHGAWVISSHYTDSKESQQRIITMDANEKDLMDGKYSRHIALEPEWLDLLTPFAPYPPRTNDTWQPNTLENILSNAGLDTLLRELRYGETYIWQDGTCTFGHFPPEWTDLEIWNSAMCLKTDRVAFIERTLARLVTDGLSRRLSYRAFDRLPNLQSWVTEGKTNDRNVDFNLRLIKGDLKPSENAYKPPKTPDLISQRVEFVVSGYGYLASETTDYLATLVVAIYLLAATCHVLQTILITPVTSTSWNSALELVLLAFNSIPTPALRGTSAGIHRWRTYKHLVKVGAVPEPRETRSTLNADEDGAGSEVSLDTASTELQVCLVIETETEAETSNAQCDSAGNALLKPESNDGNSTPDNRLKPATSVNVVASPSISSRDSRNAAVNAHVRQHLNVRIDKKYL